MAKQGSKPRKKKIRWQPIPKPPEGKITYLRSPNDQAAEIWITVFQMQHKRKIRDFLKCVDEHDDGYHPISYQIERGVRYL